MRMDRPGEGQSHDIEDEGMHNKSSEQILRKSSFLRILKILDTISHKSGFDTNLGH